MTQRVAKIYMITNIVNNKKYIGQTISSIEHRWDQHTSNARRYTNKCRYLENAIRKYGEHNFTK
jgi:hypothetical protein